MPGSCGRTVSRNSSRPMQLAGPNVPSRSGSERRLTSTTSGCGPARSKGRDPGQAPGEWQRCRGRRRSWQMDEILAQPGLADRIQACISLGAAALSRSRRTCGRRVSGSTQNRFGTSSRCVAASPLRRPAVPADARHLRVLADGRARLAGPDAAGLTGRACEDNQSTRLPERIQSELRRPRRHEWLGSSAPVAISPADRMRTYAGSTAFSSGNVFDAMPWMLAACSGLPPHFAIPACRVSALPGACTSGTCGAAVQLTSCRRHRPTSLRTRVGTSSERRPQQRWPGV